jgi:hypothetical protein
MAAKAADRREVDGDFAVAEHAFFKRRNASAVGFYRGCMAEEAAYLLIGGVDTMTEGDRLLRGSTDCPDRIENVIGTKQKEQCHSEQQGQHGCESVSMPEPRLGRG